MQLEVIDWLIVFALFAFTLSVGIYSARRAGKDATEFFLSGRNMPWWLLGISMVATTFSADTPNLVTDIVRKNGVAGNWVWWAFLLTGMLTVFIYARLWRRSGVLTDIEFYELRYSGRSAAFLRGFRALYLGLFFNVVIMSTVSLAAIKIGGVMLGLSPLDSVVWASLVTVAVATLGGLRAVLLSDFVLFALAMIGAVAAAVFALNAPEVGGLASLMAAPELAGKLSFFPELMPASGGGYTTESINLLVSVLIIPLAVQWWSVWYPSAEPGGGGYVAQRMLAARNERHARAAVLLFNAAYYGLRPWPWILVGLCSLLVFPDLASIGRAFPGLDPSIINDDLAYPAMLQRVLPPGWLGLVIASLAAAYISTISTHLNWGSSYIVHDFYRRFLKPAASEREQVLVGRISIVVMMFIAGFIALQLSNALQGFEIMLQIGAGTGLLFILRWFWWRINAVSEVVAMVVSFAVALGFKLGGSTLASWQELLLGVTITTVAWVTATLLTPPADEETLKRFCRTINPGGPGWTRIYAKLGTGEVASSDRVNIPRGILCMILGCLGVYTVLFGTGAFLYGDVALGGLLVTTAVLATLGLVRLKFND
ncbi:MAG: sodium:solute symporter family protein [Pseudomonadota bacterium]